MVSRQKGVRGGNRLRNVLTRAHAVTLIPWFLVFVVWLQSRAEIKVLRAEVKDLRKANSSSYELQVCQRRLSFITTRFRPDWHGLSQNRFLSHEMKWRMTNYGKSLWQNRTLQAPISGNGRTYLSQVASRAVLRVLHFENGRPIWSQQVFEAMQRAPTLSCPDYPHSAEDLKVAFAYAFSHNSPQEFAVFSSISPWAEMTIWQVFPKTQITTVEFNPPILTHNLSSHKLRIFSQAQIVDEYAQKGPLFDAAVAFSGIEHDGLGRYGDPVDPDGDIAAVHEIALLLKPNGILFLAVPVVEYDDIAYIYHRLYGPNRLLRLFSVDFDLIARVWDGQNYDLQSGYHTPPNIDDWQHQPVLILRKRSKKHGCFVNLI